MSTIVIEGARENNLRDVSLEIPKQALTVFVGVSGSGKSSLVRGTIAAESQRQLNETFPAYIRDRLPKVRQPEATRLDHLTPAVVVDQRPVTGSVRSTVGTMTDISTMLRILYSRVAEPSAGESSAYSFNEPSGMCPRCQGLGRTSQVVLERLLDEDRSLNEGAIRFPTYARGSVRWQIYADTGVLDPEIPVKDFSRADRELLLRGNGFKVLRGTRAGPSETGNVYEGLLDSFDRLYLRRDPAELTQEERTALNRVIEARPCDECHGQRLNAAARASKIEGRNIAELSALEVVEVIDALEELDAPTMNTVVEAAVTALRRIDAVGLGYLSLDRPVPTLSGGEAQRLRTVRHLGSSLSGLTYVLDEPSVGLHPRDVDRLTRLLRDLREAGNTVLVVEHDRDVIEAADHLVELGPGAGSEGGAIVYEGSLAGLRSAGTVTGRALSRSQQINRRPRRATGALTIAGASRNNLRDLTVDIPTGVLTAITGVAGSGKSTLVADVLVKQHPEVTVIDQSPIGGSPRSTPASYVGAWDRIRRRFAEVSGERPGMFSFNSDGGCPKCGGRGTVTIDLAYMAPATRTCEACDGTRYGPQALQHKWEGRTIVDILDMTAHDATGQLDDDLITGRLQRLVDVGLGHLTLGRPLVTLSGGERQRLKVANRLSDATTTLVLDEPTTGLHINDVEAMLALLDQLVDAGNTVIAVEHHADVIAHADWVIDLGPEAGRHGGQVVFEGTPAEMVSRACSHTADHLRRRFGAAQPSPYGR